MPDKVIPPEPVAYLVQEKSLVGNELHEAGATVMYAGLPAENLKPTCAIGEARYQEYLALNAERVRLMKDQYSESAVGDQAAFAKLIAVAFVEAMATKAPAKEPLVLPPAKNAAKPSLV